MFRSSRRTALVGIAAFGASVLLAGASVQAKDWHFTAIEGGEINLAQWAGQPVLVINTASHCGFTYQYDGIQALYDRYRDQGLVILTVPSGDFNQELETEAEVKEFCEVNFALDVPMTEITHVRGNKAHPFYQWLASTEGWAPTWNFNKVLIAPDGSVAGTWRSATRPQSAQITRQIESLLGKG